jgi:transcription elongation factor GreA
LTKGEVVSIAAGQPGSITREGYERLQSELEELVKVRRPEIARWLRDAREDGGEAGENLDLAEALDEQALLERRIAELQGRLALARIVECAADGTADIGAHVRLRTPGGQTALYQLVGALESDPGRRLLSIDSPVGQALLGRTEGDVVEVEAPGGRRRFEIVAIAYSAEALAA